MASVYGLRVVVGVLALFAAFPAGAGAYYDASKSGYDIDVHDVGVGAIYEAGLGYSGLAGR